MQAKVEILSPITRAVPPVFRNPSRHMKVSQIMTQPAVSVGPDASVRDIARLLLRNRISGVPVVDADNRPIGMVSEGDFLNEQLPERETRREWWLNVLAGGQDISAEYVRHLEHARSTARQIMSQPAITVSQDDDLRSVAGLFDQRRIKRAPVVRDGRLVGIVTRADLLAAFANGGGESLPERPAPAPPCPIAAPVAPPQAPARSGEAAPNSAAGFRQLAARHSQREAEARRSARDQARALREAEVQALLAAPLTEADWRAMLAAARHAAESGLAEWALMRFPAALCTDGGRAVNVPDPTWPATLRGKAALVYLRWRQELQPEGFRMSARIATFPDGLPGEIELSLAWGAAAL